MSGQLTIGSLFAGIGGFDLGFERAGFKTVWQVEKNAYCRRVLRRHFPDADRRVTDVRFAGARNLLPVDVICGGFPCQDISNAGLRAGITGSRSGLWSHACRIIDELRPDFALLENVAALLGRGISRVLGDLSEIGYDAEWQIISAADVGAPHLRERVWIVAYPESEQWERCGDSRGRRIRPSNRSEVMAHASSLGCQGPRESVLGAYPAETGEGQADHALAVSIDNQWRVEPDVGRVAHGIPARVDRLRALGNAVVPQIPELIAQRLTGVLGRGEQR